MKRDRRILSKPVLVLALLGGGLSALAAPGKPPKPAPDANSAPAPAEIPQSVFVIPASPKEGRNPFFPHAIAASPVAQVRRGAVDTSGIVLNGVTSRPKPSVMINGITFEKGEEHEIRLAGGGRVKVLCQDIHEDSASVVINGTQTRELRLRAGL